MSVSQLEDCEFLKDGLDELVEFDGRCSQFVDRMRLSSSFELVQRIKAFVNSFFALQLTHEDEASQLMRSFYQEMRLSLRDSPLWREEQEVDWGIEALEKYLTHKLYKVTYYIVSSSDQEDDEKFYHRIRTLQFLRPEHLDIPPRALNRIVFEMAVEELARADHEKCKSPKEKLTCILNCIMVLTNLLKHYEQEKGTGADSLLPYLIYTILLLSPKQMHSNLRFIRRFRQESQLKGEASYYFTQMESAVMFIAVVDHKSLSISEEEFRSGVEQMEEKIASGLDIPSRLDYQHPLRARPSFTTSATAAGGIASGSGQPPSSPMIERRTSVLNEWSKLQKSHSLTRIDPPKPSPDTAATSQPPSSSSISSSSSSSALLQSSQQSASGGYVSLDGQHLAGSSGGSTKVVQQHPNTGSASSTQDATASKSGFNVQDTGGNGSSILQEQQLPLNNSGCSSLQGPLYHNDSNSGYVTQDQLTGIQDPPRYQSSGAVPGTSTGSYGSTGETATAAVGSSDNHTASEVQHLLQLDFEQLTISDLKLLHARLKTVRVT